MHILFLFLTYFISILHCEISIKNSGVAALTRGDIGMIFYLTIENTGSCKYRINARMIKCCEILGENDTDCRLMQLMGGDMGYLQPNMTRNITLFYPNMYPHNRKGRCVISVTYEDNRNIMGELRDQISFNTIIPESSPNPILRGYYSRNEFKKCQTIDQDPLDNCQPVNCHMKYLGSRNYFNHHWKRCQKVPICIADPDKTLPDVSYYPISNKCHDLEDLINAEDLKDLEKGIAEGSWIDHPLSMLTVNLRCNHGALSNETGFCVCDDGWMSAPVDKDLYEPTLSVYHMCNVKISTWNNVNGTKMKMTALVIAILGTGFAISMILIAFVCHLLYNCIKPPDNFEPRPFESLPSDQSLLQKSSAEFITEHPSNIPDDSLQKISKRDSLILHKIKSKNEFEQNAEEDGDESLKIIKKLSPTTLTYAYERTTDDTTSPELEDDTAEGEEEMIVTESFYPRRSISEN